MPRPDLHDRIQDQRRLRESLRSGECEIALMYDIDLDEVAGKPGPASANYAYNFAINNSFGFGGHNVALAFGRY